MIQTCKNCEDRTVGCHSTCERYIKAKAEHDAIREAEYELKTKARAVNSVRYGSLEKQWRGHGKKFDLKGRR